MSSSANWSLELSLSANPVKKVTDFKCILGEGPVWDPGKSILWWVDIKNRKIFSRHDGGEIEVINTRGQVSCLGLWDKDHLVIAEETGIFKLHSPNC